MAPQERTKQAGPQVRGGRADKAERAGADGRAGQAEHAGAGRELPRARTMNSGNPRVTVAFPFSKIEIREPPDALRDLAAIVDRLAGQVTELARTAAPAQAEEASQIATAAALLARRIAVA